MNCFRCSLLVTGLVGFTLAAGCQSPYHADRGALLGGLGGAGVGALVGHAVGNTGAGAVIGAGVGALSGAAIGSGMDEVEARNRAMIEQTMQRQVSASAVTFDDVVAMTQAGVAEELIVNHVRAHGVVRQLTASDIIMLQQQNVKPAVIRAMQEPPPAQRETVVVGQPRQVIVEEHYYHDPWGPRYYPGPCYRPYYGHPGPRVGVGVSWRN